MSGAALQIRPRRIYLETPIKAPNMAPAGVRVCKGRVARATTNRPGQPKAPAVLRSVPRRLARTASRARENNYFSFVSRSPVFGRSRSSAAALPKDTLRCPRGFPGTRARAPTLAGSPTGVRARPRAVIFFWGFAARGVPLTKNRRRRLFRIFGGGADGPARASDQQVQGDERHLAHVLHELSPTSTGYRWARTASPTARYAARVAHDGAALARRPRSRNKICCVSTTPPRPSS